MDANIVGLIVLDNGLTCHVAEASHGNDQALEPAWLDPFTESIGGDTEKPQNRLPHMYQTTFLRADIEQLNSNLESEFNSLLQRLFET
jgi:hypothetical protein